MQLTLNVEVNISKLMKASEYLLAFDNPVLPLKDNKLIIVVRYEVKMLFFNLFLFNVVRRFLIWKITITVYRRVINQKRKSLKSSMLFTYSQ